MYNDILNFKLILVIQFQGTDPYLIFENPLCSNVFGVIGNVDINKNVEEKKKK